MTPIYRHPMFLVGVAIRLAMIALIAPTPVETWYAPFLGRSIDTVTIDPWSAWLASGGTPAAFPYGYAMWIVFLPLALAAKLTGLAHAHAYAVTLLVADFCFLLALNRLVPSRPKLLLAAYWLSPVVLLATYAYGFNDLVPTLALVLAILFVREARLGWAGVFLAAAISAKLSMVAALPFFAVYLLNNRALRRRLREFVLGFLSCAAVLGLPFLLSTGAVQMLAGNPELGKVYKLELSFGGGFSVYLVPLAYLLLLYFTWRIRRLNFDIFHATMGLAFLVLVLLTPAAPGWFIWCVPFLVLYQAFSGRTAMLLAGAFAGLYALNTLLVTPVQLANHVAIDLASALHVTGRLEDRTVSLLHTAMLGIGIILATRIWREAVGRNDYFRASRRPFVLGVAGDSGAGKDTFVDAIARLFGEHSVVRISGDDYHLWDRHKPMWHVMTHLNPMANDLEGFSRDLLALADGKAINLKHYDHESGKITRPVRTSSNDFIIASGLHALYLPMLRDCYDLKVYLDIDERLRRHFKIRRDVGQRGHAVERVLASLEKREPDSRRFIWPQAEHADLILSLQPLRPGTLDAPDTAGTVRTKLFVRSRQRFDERSTYRVLVAICGLHVDMETSADGSESRMTIEGEATAEDIAMAAGMLCPRMREFLDIPPAWLGGSLGLMQLLTLCHISNVLAKRLIW